MTLVTTKPLRPEFYQLSPGWGVLVLPLKLHSHVPSISRAKENTLGMMIHRHKSKSIPYAPSDNSLNLYYLLMPHVIPIPYKLTDTLHASFLTSMKP